jgi:hypothetical protein
MVATTGYSRKKCMMGCKAIFPRPTEIAQKFSFLMKLYAWWWVLEKLPYNPSYISFWNSL